MRWIQFVRDMFIRAVSRNCERKEALLPGNVDERGRRFPHLYLALAVCTALGLSGIFLAAPVKAKEETEKSEEEILEEMRERCDSIVHIESICWDGESVIYGTRSFSGIVVTQETAGIYVVTVQENLTWTTEEKETLRSQYELDSNARISEKIEVVFDGDLRIEASVAGESEQRNLAVLKLSQTVQFENILAFAKEDAAENARIYLLSFPESAGESEAAYNSENVSVTPGMVLQTYQENGSTFLKHDIPADMYSVGGPILNVDGAINGLLLTSGEDGGGTAVSSETIKAFLDTFEISYEEQEPETEEKGISVLNLALGAVAAVLLVIVIYRGQKSRPLPEESGSGGYAHKKRGSGDRHVQKRNHAGKLPDARLEYPAAKRAAVIGKTEFVIGRIREADFALTDCADISRRHANILCDGKNFYLMDLHSVNHTFLNGRQLIPEEKYMLNNGDEIVLAKEHMIFYRKGR